MDYPFFFVRKEMRIVNDMTVFIIGFIVGCLLAFIYRRLFTSDVGTLEVDHSREPPKYVFVVDGNDEYDAIDKVTKKRWATFKILHRKNSNSYNDTNDQ